MDTSLKYSILKKAFFMFFLGTMFFMAYSVFSFRQSYTKTEYHGFFVSTTSMNLSCTYDVFPSFHGGDVRKGFRSHLLKEFKSKKIDTFVDNEIERGKTIGSRIIKSIRGSKIAIVVLSRNFASSLWCLNELAEIMKCRKELGQTVMVVFYDVDPSDVRKQTGYFGSIFQKTCAGRKEEDIQRWRQALSKVSTISGYHSRNWHNEADMIEQIANDVIKKLNNSTNPSSKPQ